MWQHFKLEQNKNICAACIHSGGIVGYDGKGKNRTMQLLCEVKHKAVSQNFYCPEYKGYNTRE